MEDKPKAKESLKVAKESVKAPKLSKDVLKVKNISNRVINTSKCSINPDASGTATRAEVRTYSEFLKEI